ncbi:MAG TPA: GNAT family N-acetyltransferase [Candidatus Dormibacteraeota bacterium]|jgi:GNAT superfamily N-acetyltransferase|nr:GNAT family N-acetyltransferase [Candidatus Dormibacteraeota bacterium]
MASQRTPKIDVVPFEERFLEQAASLLSGEYRRMQEHGAVVPAPFLDRGRTLEVMARMGGSDPGVAAMHAGRLVGFLCIGPRAWARLWEHHAEAPHIRATYRLLYAAVADRLVGLRQSRHHIEVAVDAAESVAAWFELGFGVGQIKGLRPIPSTPRARPLALPVRPAHPEDLDQLVDLSVELVEFHATSPVLGRSNLSRSDAAREVHGWMANDAAAIWVAEIEGHLVGMMAVEQDQLYESTAIVSSAGTTQRFRSQGIGGAILARVEEWAHRRDCRNLAVGWNSANLLSDAFWRGHGFQPVHYALSRDFAEELA